MKEAGRIIISDPGQDAPLEEYATAQCVHCARHFRAKKPGTVARALTEIEARFRERERKQVYRFCTRCNGPVCSAGCEECVHWKKKLEIAEGAASPTAVTVGGNLWMPSGA